MASDADSKKMSEKEKKKLREKQARERKAQIRAALDAGKVELERAKTSDPKNANGKRPRNDDEEAVEIEYIFRPPREVADAIALHDNKTTDPSSSSPPPPRYIPQISAAATDHDNNNDNNDNNHPSSSHAAFAEVFAKYYSQLNPPPPSTLDPTTTTTTTSTHPSSHHALQDMFDLDHDEDNDAFATDDASLALASKRKRKLATRLPIATLKQFSSRPDTVEVWDPTAPDPLTLIHLKALRNAVPVPRHWSQKRAYLAGKRGLDKPPFALPAFISATGIAALREAYVEKQDDKKSKQKARERVRPKMNRLDINYQVLRDAFFKHQTKPKLSQYGDVYYEGREYESSEKHYLPGVLSDKLREALALPTNANASTASKVPPPWLINMQRYGPPPSYTTLRIPGLNAPLPPGCRYGYGPGEWGKPPVDATGRPLYGDVFGGREGEAGGGEEENQLLYEEDVDKGFEWGRVEVLEEEEEDVREGMSDDEGEMEEEEAVEADEAGGVRSMMPGGVASVLPPPGSLDLRKDGTTTETPLPASMASGGGERPLYHVLEEKRVGVGAGLLGVDHVYVLPTTDKPPPAPAAAAVEEDFSDLVTEKVQVKKAKKEKKEEKFKF